MHRFKPLSKPLEMLWPQFLLEEVGILTRVEPAHRLVLGIVPSEREA